MAIDEILLMSSQQYEYIVYIFPDARLCSNVFGSAAVWEIFIT